MNAILSLDGNSEKAPFGVRFCLSWVGDSLLNYASELSSLKNYASELSSLKNLYHIGTKSHCIDTTGC